MWARATAGKGSQEEHGDVHVAVIGADELIRAALEGQILLADAIHPADAPVVEP
jgi:voltage-gated potassium channel Kch